MSDDDEFFAWLDGELSSKDAARVAARVAADPALAALASQHRAMRARLKDAFDPIAEAPLPERLRAAVDRPHADIIDLAAAKEARDRRPAGKLPQWVAMAATLAIGVVAGTMLPDRGGAPIEVAGSNMYAAAALDRALDAQLASAPSDGPVRIGMTFRDRSGAICRSFTNLQSSGLACRSGGRWAVRGLFAAPEGQASDYRMAAGGDPNLAALIDSTIAGEPFDGSREKAAKTRGWR